MSSVGEIVLILVAAQVLERQDDNGEAWGGRELVVNGSGHETWRVASTPSKGPHREKRESESGGERPPAQESARFRRGRRALGFGRRDRLR